MGARGEEDGGGSRHRVTRRRRERWASRRKRTVWLGRTLSHNARARWTCAPGRAAKSSLARSFSWILKVGTSRLIAPPRPRRRPSRRTKE